MLSVGDKRIIHFIETEPTAKVNIGTNTTFPLRHGSVFVLHPQDEKPCFRSSSTIRTTFKHGNIRFGGKHDNMSIAFVFRHTTATDLFHVTTGHLFINAFNHKKYEGDIRTHILDAFKSNPYAIKKAQHVMYQAHKELIQRHLSHVPI